MPFYRPFYVNAGFHAHDVEPDVRELVEFGEQWVPTDYLIQPHFHEAWEIYLQLEGTSTWLYEDERYELAPGLAHAVRPGARHGMLMEAPKESHFVYAAIDVKSVIRRHPRIRKAWSSSEPVRVFDGKGLELAFRLLVNEGTGQGRFRADSLRLAVDQLVIMASRERLRDDAAPVKPLLPVPRAALRARELIDEEPHAAWTLAKLARRVGVSQSHLSAIFRSSFGHSPYHYVLYRRLERAKERLLASDLPVTRIALELGFASSQHFANAFRKYTGQKPTAFRERARRVQP